MFIKAFRVKNNIQVKSSEVKKLKTKLSQQYKLNEDELSILLPSKSSVQSVKATTHGEQQLIIFTVDKRPMFFEFEDRIYPTVYWLWLIPSCVPYFTTHPQVLPKLANGANLMMPGVVKEGSDRKSFGRFQKNQIVAVNLSSNASAVGVGVLALDSEDMYMSAGHGICVKMLHVFGDKLWGMEGSVTQQIPVSKPAVRQPNLNSEQDFPELGSVPSNSQPQEQNDDDSSSEDDSESQQSEGNQALNPDDILKSMFMSALKINKKELLSLLPIQVGTFYPTYVLKQKHPNGDKSVSIKETSYKKVSTFIKQMTDEGFIVVKEENKGVEKIISINYEHPELVTHIPFKVKSEDAKSEQSCHMLLTKMTELYVVNESTKKIFNALGVKDGNALDSTEIKNYVKDYVSRKKLLDPITKQALLDDVLVEICLGKRENEDPVRMSLDEIIANVNSKMDNTFEMRSQSGPLIRGGKKPIIQITIATRMGNKKVTLISNLEAYGINIAEFSKACKIGVQASTSITKTPGSNTNQFQIQGNQVRFVYSLLTETYKIAKGNISGLEFAKKDKTKKK